MVRLSLPASLLLPLVLHQCATTEAFQSGTGPLGLAKRSRATLTTSFVSTTSTIPGAAEVQKKVHAEPLKKVVTGGNNDNDIDEFTKRDNEVPSLGSILRMLPKESFDIDTKTSLFYFGVDLAAVVACLGFLNTVVTSDIYHSLPMWGQALTVAPLQVLSGFAMWCMWCIGHDAGHGTVSKKNWINQVVGEVSICP